MAFVETFEYKIEINPSKYIHVRRSNIISQGGIEVARSYTREVFPPNADVSSQPQLVQDVAAVVWAS